MFSELLAEEGDGIPIVYVPGIDGTGRKMFGGAERIASRFRLLRLHHLATDSPSADSYGTLAESIVRVLDERRIERALVLAESFGGAIALQCALDHPTHVAGLAIVNSFAHYAARLRLAWSRAFTPIVPGRLFEQLRTRFGPWSMFGTRQETDALARFYADTSGWSGPAYQRRLRMIAKLDLRDRLPEIRQPTLLVAGDRDRVVASVENARRMAQLLPNAELEIVEGGGHLILPLEGVPWVDWLEKLAVRAGLE